MKKILAGLALLLSSSISYSQLNNPKDLEDLRKINALFIHNFITNDTISHSKIIHPDFVMITSSGAYIKRQDYLNIWQHGSDSTLYWDVRDERINIFGNTALVHSANKYVVLRGGKEASGMSMYTDTYIKEKGTWRCIQAHITNVSPQFYPPDETIVKIYDRKKNSFR